MCGSHNKIVDDLRTRDKFPVGLLKKYKEEHECKFENAVVNSELSEAFVSYFISFGPVTSYDQAGGQIANIIINNPLPSEPQIKLEVQIEPPRVSVAHPDIDVYDFRISLHNKGDITVRDFRVDVRIPTAYSNRTTTIIAAEVSEQRTSTTRLFRRTSDLDDWALYPGDTRAVLSLDFVVTRQQYQEGITESISVAVYCGDRLTGKTEYSIASLLKPERVQYFLGK
jgi:hypothetical protein